MAELPRDKASEQQRLDHGEQIVSSDNVEWNPKVNGKEEESTEAPQDTSNMIPSSSKSTQPETNATSNLPTEAKEKESSTPPKNKTPVPPTIVVKAEPHELEPDQTEGKEPNGGATLGTGMQQEPQETISRSSSFRDKLVSITSKLKSTFQDADKKELQTAEAKVQKQAEDAASIARRTRAGQDNPAREPLHNYWEYAAKCVAKRTAYVMIITLPEPDKSALKSLKHTTAKMMKQLRILYEAVMDLENNTAVREHQKELEDDIQVANAQYYAFFPRASLAGTSVTSSSIASSRASLASMGNSDRAKLLIGATGLASEVTNEERSVNEELDNAMTNLEQAQVNATTDLTADKQNLAEAERQLKEVQTQAQQADEWNKRERDLNRQQADENQKREDEAAALARDAADQAANQAAKAQIDAATLVAQAANQAAKAQIDAATLVAQANEAQAAAQQKKEQNERERQERNAKREQQNLKKTQDTEKERQKLVKKQQDLQATVDVQQVALQQSQEKNKVKMKHIGEQIREVKQIHQDRLEAIKVKHGRAFADLMNSFLGDQPSVPYLDEESILDMMEAGAFDDIANDYNLGLFGPDTRQGQTGNDPKRTPEEVTRQGQLLNVRMNAVFTTYYDQKESKRRQEANTYSLKPGISSKQDACPQGTPAQVLLRPQADVFTPKGGKLNATSSPLIPEETSSKLDLQRQAKEILRNNAPLPNLLQLARECKAERGKHNQPQERLNEKAHVKMESRQIQVAHQERPEDGDTASQHEMIQATVQGLHNLEQHQSNMENRVSYQLAEMEMKRQASDMTMKQELYEQYKQFSKTMEEMRLQMAAMKVEQRPSESPIQPAHSSERGEQPEIAPREVHNSQTENPLNDSKVNESLNQTLLQQLTQAIAQNRLPLQQPTVFEGDPLKYPAWRASFSLLIEGQSITNDQKLFYLQQYVGGRALDTIANFFLLRKPTSYTEAIAMLKQRYGHPLAISRAFREKLDNWPIIRARDGPGLRSLSDFLQQCVVASEVVGQLAILDDAHYQCELVKKLPEWAFFKWRSIVARTTETSGTYPTFKVLAKFVEKQANEACEPLFVQANKTAVTTTAAKTERQTNEKGKQSYAVSDATPGPKQPQQNNQRMPNQKPKTEATETVVQNQTEPNPRMPQGSHPRQVTYDTDRPAWNRNNSQKQVFKCIFHQSNGHSSEECSDMKRKSPNECFEIYKSSGVCLGCANSFSHFKADCKDMKLCAKCNKTHLTLTHGSIPLFPRRPQGAYGQASQQAAQGSSQPQASVSASNSTGQSPVEIPKETKGTTGVVQRGHKLPSVEEEFIAQILPVYLSSKQDPSREIMVYAMVDTMSAFTFISSVAAEQLNTLKTDSAVKIHTLSAKDEIIPCQRITGLQVRGLNSKERVDLPTAYTTTQLMANRESVPTKATARRHEHLSHLEDQLHDFMPNVLPGVLIGFNCTQAHMPLEVVPGEPYAIKTKLGWAIQGQTNSTVPVGNIIHSHYVVCLPTTSREIPTSFVYRTKVSEATVTDLLRVMERDVDDVEQGTASQDNRKFWKILSDGIGVNDEATNSPAGNTVLVRPAHKVTVMVRAPQVQNEH